MSSDPDEELVRRVGSGDAAAMQTMVARKLPRLLALATRMLGDATEAEDVAQEAFMRIWHHARGWRPGPARFDTWIHRVTLNLCYDRMRRRRAWLGDDLPEVVDPGSDPHIHLQEDMSRRVEEALQVLAPRQREAIVLTYYQEMTNTEAAAVMAISVDALESLLARGRRSLQTLLVRDATDE